jgi:methyltransferase, UbiE/COQ5 family
MGLLRSFLRNTRKPEGFLGKCMVASMNHAHAALADWGLGYLPKTGPVRIAELGCGGGRNIRALLRKSPAATVTALDYSEISVEKARNINQEELQVGRCRVIQGDVSHLPFEDGVFDLATAFETVYFWPGPTESFREVYRTLRPGGVFLIVNEVDGENPRDSRWLSVMDGMKIFNRSQFVTFLTEAGFSKVIVKRDAKRHWLCVLAIRDDAGHLGNK